MPMSETLRVLLASHRCPPDAVAGVERITQALGAQLVKRGDTVSIVTRRPGRLSHVIEKPQLLRGWLPDGTPIYRLTGNLEYPAEFMVHEAQMAHLLTSVMIEEAP